MVKRQPELGQNFLKKLDRWRSRETCQVKSFLRSSVRSLFLAVLLFFLSMGGTLVADQVRASTSIVQNQADTSQLVEQGKALYEVGKFEEAVIVWQEAEKAFAAIGDKLNQAMALSNLSLTLQQVGQWDKAKEAIAQSLNLLQTLEKTPTQLRILGSTLDIQGQLQLAVGESSKALLLFCLDPNKTYNTTQLH
ncbi:tetratricopeptide repeat protein [Scytonema sp. NUACC26]|uniref:tetratricopeptide repeat protein n=1 Tax=Scytonema sp. NUACC26 TaxID=3140176 RepID=UPI0034DC5ECA